ncbi:hypothetical protein RRG08_025163 [Elysia crispata]|uniref:Uncharacterized protein n=1 Tax=Elysia crispata TaxID=231223 RepID=A0AAE1AUQ2_9GAST|nr:hypothetical protein RRG08_025163 [Elysia crispata]
MRSQTLHDRACVMSYNSICQKNIDNPCDDVLPGAEYCTGSCFKAVTPRPITPAPRRVSAHAKGPSN